MTDGFVLVADCNLEPRLRRRSIPHETAAAQIGTVDCSTMLSARISAE
ncbi:hypothetical protein OP10G_4442 [Fimbriimonas ginsengisoli Gsoil 348]|uniref:Uncharacterized protein n=2 Tax=Fimbriimonas ginsengisoli TaxID=1005039 RepID=A0A068NY36_FIMGI|nr:hypothetical protein OP10G_4442 [Fimbriimonas ginsengisoli Gsoil 348]